MTQIETTSPLERLEALYADCGAEIYRWVLGMLDRPEDAEDAVQSLWVKLARDSHRLDEVRDLSAYLWRSARNHVYSELRRRALERLWTPPLSEDHSEWLTAADESGVTADDLRDVAGAVRHLRPKLRAVVLLVGFAGCTVDEAARRLEIPRGTAASRYHAALRKLKKNLGVEETDHA
ncbi:MAG: sigma-70 family RNA polymerase sigma factor [Acidobacteriota bacterium]